MARYLLTGSSGFIGSALKAELLKQGHTVTVLPHKVLYQPKNLKDQCLRLNPEYIVHLASYGNKYNQQDAEAIIKGNMGITLNLLFATLKVPYKAFINTGSSSEYGFKKMPMKETDSLDTTTFYGASKASSTMLCRAFALRYHKPVVTARPFSVYGVGDDPKHFIPTAIKAFKEGSTLNLAPGVHDWINVKDYIQGVLILCNNASFLSGRAVNIGTGIQTSNYEIAGILRDVTGRPGKIKRIDRIREYDSESWVADNSLLKSLGWRQKYNLEEDLEYMWTKAFYGN